MIVDLVFNNGFPFFSGRTFFISKVVFKFPVSLLHFFFAKTNKSLDIQCLVLVSAEFSENELEAWAFSDHGGRREGSNLEGENITSNRLSELVSSFFLAVDTLMRLSRVG